MSANKRRRARIVNNVCGVACLTLVFSFPLALSWSESGRVPFFDSPAPVHTPDERFHVETEPECEIYEDGSYECDNGVTGCYSDAPCNDGSDEVCVNEDDTYCWWHDDTVWVWIADPLSDTKEQP